MSYLFIMLCIVERPAFSDTNFLKSYFIFNCILFYDDDDDAHPVDYVYHSVVTFQTEH